MDAMTMLRAAALLFALAALGGLAMAGIRLGGNRNPPAWLAFGHGLLAAAGLTLLAYACLYADVPKHALWALALLLASAGGGALMNLGYHWRQLPLPKALLVGHLLIAATGFVLLLTAIF